MIREEMRRGDIPPFELSQDPAAFRSGRIRIRQPKIIVIRGGSFVFNSIQHGWTG
jgi:hypothetical protein